MSRKRIDLGARLRKSRALSVCLGERSLYIKPYDRKPGRPTVQEGLCLRAFKDPILKYDPSCYDDDGVKDFQDSFLIDAADNYLKAVGLVQGWFQVTERANLLGTHVSILVRQFDVLVHRASLLEMTVGCVHRFEDRREACNA